MDESLRIQTFQELPSTADFVSLIESRNVPAVFKGCAKDWKAFSKWNPSNGGLDYLQDRVGSCAVEAMLSKTAPVFYGNLGNHERVPLPFSSFIGFCKQHMENTDDHGVCFEPENHELVESSMDQSCLPSTDDPRQIYLAQVPIVNIEDEERVQLGTLREDIQMPAILETKSLASINMWMNSSRARSSTHYDPHHNLLCIVAGCKQAVLWPPSASSFLYPMPIYGEASNHSSVSLENPELSMYPRAEYTMEYSQKVILHAGDALFIPEGWFHQVDSDDLTIAVNFWWRSDMMSSMSEHMDAYYMRRIIRRLTDREMNQVLQKTNSTGIGRRKNLTCQSSSNVEAECSVGQACEKENLNKRKLQFKITLQELEPLALQALHELVSLVHQRVDPSYENDSKINVEDDCKRIETTDFFVLEGDPVAMLLWTLQPCTLQDVFLAMAHNFPRTLEALVLHLLSPVGAEVLTRKFDEMDQQTNEEDRSKFYEVFYGVFDNQFAAMNAILKGKESFALKAFKNVLDKYAGINFKGPNPWVR